MEWLSTITQEQVLTYAPIYALTVTILIFTYSQHQKKKVESAQLSFDINKMMYEVSILNTRTLIYHSMDLKKPLEVLASGQSQSDPNSIPILERDVDEFLNVLEEIGLFVNKNVLDKDFAYEMFGFQIISIHDYEPIKNYMQNQRIIHHQKDLWSQFEKAYVKVLKLKNKKNIGVKQKF